MIMKTGDISTLIKKKTMSKANKNRNGSMILFVCACVAATIVALNLAPKDPSPLELEKYEKVKPTEPYQTWYGFSDGSWSTLSRHPITHERGEQITEKELETLKLAE
jgi:hypothetical protein